MIDVRLHAVASGVYQCNWQLVSPEGVPRRCDAVLVEVENAPPSWGPLADILIASARGHVTTAIAAARALARQCPGCAVVAVPVGGRAVVICSAGQIAITRRRAGGALETAVWRYGQLLSGRQPAVPAEAACCPPGDRRPAGSSGVLDRNTPARHRGHRPAR